MGIVQSLTDAMTPVTDERTGQPSKGWDNRGFPEFSFGNMCLVHAVWCAVDGGTSFYVIADNSENAKEMLLPLVRAERQQATGDTPDSRVFDSPNSWLVKAVGVSNPLPVAVESMASEWWIPMYLLAEVAPGIRRVATDPCCSCKEPLFVSGKDCTDKNGADYRRVVMVYERSGVGEGVFLRCPHCKEANWLTE
jgi:hypothetical protein